MASQLDTLEGSTPIRSPADEFYNFFRNNFSDLDRVFPTGFNEIQLIEGTAGTVGSIYRLNYALAVGGISLTASIRTETIDDDARSITFNCLEGEVLQLYNVFQSTLNVRDGLAQWTFTYERRTPLSPPPELYVAFAIAMSTTVDAYLLLN